MRRKRLKPGDHIELLLMVDGFMAGTPGTVEDVDGRYCAVRICGLLYPEILCWKLRLRLKPGDQVQNYRKELGVILPDPLFRQKWLVQWDELTPHGCFKLSQSSAKTLNSWRSDENP